ncbi:cell division protein PerM [Nocardiopsis eucommiae]|uniref:cell division protein PerM n=1 Tax=Nocardiopsis eucommiae TaxID=2831970 RepID=UPI003D750A68
MPASPHETVGRPIYATGGIAAASAAGIGLAVIVTLTMAGWVAAPHDTFGEDIADLLRGAVLSWLVGHHVSFSVAEGQISLLPMGLVLLPGLLLYRFGRWLARGCVIERLRHVHRAALAIAGPYAAIAGTLALLARTDEAVPSMPRALLMGFVIAFIAGGLGVLRQLMRDKGVAARDLLDLMPARSRSLLVGMLASTGTLLVGGLVLFLVALGLNLPEAVEITRSLAPGVVGGTLLLIVQLAYLPNAVVFAVCYALGPGFAMGVSTVVAPTEVSVGALPALPMLAALPSNGAAPVLSLGALVVPFVAGAIGGVLTQRSAPDVVSEAAPLWGFVCGVTTGLLFAALAGVAGGSLGAQRLSEVGPSAWQVGVVAALEVGVAAAVAAWIANWWYTRKQSRLVAAERVAAPEPRPEPAVPVVELPEDVPVGKGLATVTALRPREEEKVVEEAPEPTVAERRAALRRVRQARRRDRVVERQARREARRELRAQRRADRRAEGGWWRRGRGDEEAEEEMYGITYEAAPDEPERRD